MNNVNRKIFEILLQKNTITDGKLLFVGSQIDNE